MLDFSTCLMPGCNEPVDIGYCPDCKAKAEKNRKEEANKLKQSPYIKNCDRVEEMFRKKAEQSRKEFQ